MGTGGILLAENTMGQDEGGQLTYIDAKTGHPERLDFDPKEGPFNYQLLHFLNRIATKADDNSELEVTLRQVRLLENALR
jgi:predicted dehydrogenase